MKIEHFAFNVADPEAVAEWYVKNMGLTVARKIDHGPKTHFLADESGDTMIEIYNNPPGEVPPYAEMNPLIVHLAFVCEDPDTKRAELERVGASHVEDVRLDDGSILTMMRDPFGFSIQLCKRGKPMLARQQA